VHFYDDKTVSLSTGASHSYQIAVGIVDQPVKVSVAWTDVPGTPGAGTELVNDLDLTVTAPDGTMYLGNNFADGASAPGGTPDSKNNLENVYISNPAVGVYTVTVTGVNVPSGPQDYALVVSYGGGPTPVGNVFWNQGTFMSSALAGLVLMDSDLSGTAAVGVTSDTGDSETVTATEVGNASGVFLGSIQLTSAASSPGDGLLNVVNGGTITVPYNDASPPGTKTATATIDDTPPVLCATSGPSSATYSTRAPSAPGQASVYCNIASPGIPTPTGLASSKAVTWYTPGCGAMFQSRTVPTSYLAAGGRRSAISQDLGYCSKF